MVIERDLTCDEHIIQYTEDVLWNCVPETHIVLSTSVTPINSMKKKIKSIAIQKSFTVITLLYCFFLLPPHRTKLGFF